MNWLTAWLPWNKRRAAIAIALLLTNEWSRRGKIERLLWEPFLCKNAQCMRSPYLVRLALVGRDRIGRYGYCWKHLPEAL